MQARNLRIDIPLLPESSVGNALQFIDLLRAANTIARLRHGRKAPALAWQLLDARGAPIAPRDVPPWLAPSLESTEVADATPFAVFLPSIRSPDVPSLRQAVARQRALVGALVQALDAGGILATVGSAAWLAAATGRLEGREAAVPWFYVAAFRREFPDVHIAAGDPHEDGPWCSAATLHGLSALVKMLVRRAWGETLAKVCDAAFEPQPLRTRVAAQAAAQVPVTRAGALARAMRWLEDHLDQPYSLDAVAAAAAVSPRTLLRHFASELGRSPLDYLHGVRCERARVMLEITLESVPTIAASCGYTDPAAFRRVFQRYCGSTPSAYREQHRLRAPRARWQVRVGSG